MHLKTSEEFKRYLTAQCKLSNSLYNSAVYIIRQHYYQQLERDNNYSTYWKNDEYKVGRKLKQIKRLNYYGLWNQLKKTDLVAGLGANASQQLLRIVSSSIKSYNGLVSRFFDSGGDRPRLINYRKSGGLNTLTFESTNLRFEDRRVALPVPRELKPDMVCDTWIDIPDEIFIEQIKLVRIRPVAGEFWCEFVVDDEKQSYCNDEGELIKKNPQLCYHQAIAIDHGVKFWVSAVTTLGKSFIVNAPALKTAIWKYQRKVKQYKEGKSNFYWDEYLGKLTLKYNNQVRDTVNKTARFIVNRCLRDGIGNLVFGWNKGNKQNID